MNSKVHELCSSSVISLANFAEHFLVPQHRNRLELRLLNIEDFLGKTLFSMRSFMFKTPYYLNGT